jgi:hypothetical protein
VSGYRNELNIRGSLKLIKPASHSGPPAVGIAEYGFVQPEVQTWLCAFLIMGRDHLIKMTKKKEAVKLGNKLSCYVIMLTRLFLLTTTMAPQSNLLWAFFKRSARQNSALYKSYCQGCITNYWNTHPLNTDGLDAAHESVDGLLSKHVRVRRWRLCNSCSLQAVMRTVMDWMTAQLRLIQMRSTDPAVGGRIFYFFWYYGRSMGYNIIAQHMHRLLHGQELKL